MKKNLLLAVTLIAAIGTFAQQNYWTPVEEKQALSSKNTILFSKTFQPTKYLLFSLDENGIQLSLYQTSTTKPQVNNEKTSAILLNVPDADGVLHTYSIRESSVMEPQLAAKYSTIRSYEGEDVNDASRHIYFDFTTLGFHAMITSPKQPTFYINPVVSGKGLYMIFDKISVPKNKRLPECKLKTINSINFQNKNEFIAAATHATLRTYRFAITTGGEFSQLCLTGTETTDAQKKASVMSVLVTDLVRLNSVYQTDFGVRLILPNKEDRLIFLNGATDPYISDPNGIDGQWLAAGQTAIDSLLGNAGYDVGHVLMGYDTGGLSGVGIVCSTGYKAQSATGQAEDLTIDPFIIDFWAHEIGHAFGCDHTFDFAYEGTGAQMEPGSGTTIMGYAGVTGQYDVQPHSDACFHSISIKENTNFLVNGGGNTCGVKRDIGNIVPLANANADYTIPKSTPFVLTGTGSDSNKSDSLTYSWEQFDDFVDGSSKPIPTKTTKTGPVFRASLPTNSNKRYFPALPSILSGANGNKWEVLPAVKRTLNFRLTVRDNHPGGGATATDDMTVTVDSASGPFKVTSPNTNVTIGSGTTASITWNVARSNKAPVSCSKVRVLLSIDGGNTFPYVLADNISNNGKAQVTLPKVQSNQARIQIASVGNIFFDISDVNFTIASALAVKWISFNSEPTSNKNNILDWSIANGRNGNHFQIEKSIDGIHFTSIASIVDSSTLDAIKAFHFTDVQKPESSCYYRIKQTDMDGSFSYSKTLHVTTDEKQTGWNIVPNPASDVTRIIFNSNLNQCTITITNAEGKQVWKKYLISVTAGGVENIPVSAFTKGIYFITVNSDKESNTQSLLIR